MRSFGLVAFLNVFFAWNVFLVVLLLMSNFDQNGESESGLSSKNHGDFHVAPPFTFYRQIPLDQFQQLSLSTDGKNKSESVFFYTAHSNLDFATTFPFNPRNRSTESRQLSLFATTFSSIQQLLLLTNKMFFCSLSVPAVSATFLDTSHESTQQYHNYAYNTLSPSVPNLQRNEHQHTIGPYGQHTGDILSTVNNNIDEDDSTSSTVPVNPAEPFDSRRDAEYRLIRDLLSGRLHGLTNGYDRNVRPTRYMDTKLNISFGVLLSQVMDLDEKNQILTTSCWLNENWLDAYLSWDPINYGNVTVIRLPANTIWKPDILLYNNADATYYRNTIATNAIVDNSGSYRNVSLLTTSIYKSACRIDVQYFPFDQQVCNLSFGSWTFETRQLDLTLPTTEGDLSQYMENTEWNLTSMKAIREEVIFSCCPNDPYTFVHIEITMRRRPLFYVFNLILPCILITGLALLGFYTPSESGEKVTLGITTLLSLTVFLMFVGESMPPTSDTLPLIGVYYGVTIIVVSIATSLTVLTLNMHHCGNHGRVVPRWLSTAVLGYLAPILLIRVDWSENLPNSPFYTFNSEHNYYNAPGAQPQNDDNGGESAINGDQQNAQTYGTIQSINANGDTIQTSRRSTFFGCCRGGSARSKQYRPSTAASLNESAQAGRTDVSQQHKRLDNGMLKNSSNTQQRTTAFSVQAGGGQVSGGNRHRRHCHHQLHQHAYMHAATTDDDDDDVHEQEALPNSILTDALFTDETGGGDQLIRRRRTKSRVQPANSSAASAVLRTLAYNEARFLLQERLDTIKTEWQLVAMVIDRALLIIFVISTFAVSSYILLRSPYMWS